MAWRKHPEFMLHVHFWPLLSRDPRHSSITINCFESDQLDDLGRFCEFVYRVSEIFEADYSMAHILTWAELEDRLETIRRRPAMWPQASGEQTVQRFRQRTEREGFASVLWSMDVPDINTVQLRKCLPDLYWVNVFGRPYLEMFGRENILETPACEVRELSNGAVGIRLTESLIDTTEDWGSYKLARDRCKGHLDTGAFFDATMPPRHVYQVPQFQFPKEMYKEPHGFPHVQ
jgi:hypothetical protein